MALPLGQENTRDVGDTKTFKRSWSWLYNPDGQCRREKEGQFRVAPRNMLQVLIKYALQQASSCMEAVYSVYIQILMELANTSYQTNPDQRAVEADKQRASPCHIYLPKFHFIVFQCFFSSFCLPPRSLRPPFPTPSSKSYPSSRHSNPSKSPHSSPPWLSCSVDWLGR